MACTIHNALVLQTLARWVSCVSIVLVLRLVASTVNNALSRMADMAAHNKIYSVDPEYAALVAQLPSEPPTYDVKDYGPLREHFNNTFIGMIKDNFRSQLPAESTYTVNDHRVVVSGGEISVRCLTPGNSTTGKLFPLLFWIHGGGWIYGNLDTDDYYLRIICTELQIVVVNVEYRLAPEYPFPTGLNDCFTALKWSVENQSLLHASTKRGFLVGWQSAGGNFAAAVAHRARIDHFFSDFPLTGQILQIPILLHPEACPDKYRNELLSSDECLDAPLLCRKQLDKFWEEIRAEPSNPECSPLLFTSCGGLPPTYMQVCGQDPLRDEALVYEKILRENGILTKLDIYPGVGHGFHLIFPFIRVAKKFDQDFKNGVRWLLSQSA